jgi:hypothetical protein
MSNAKSSGAGPFTADGNIPGAPDQPITDLVSTALSDGQRSRPTDYIQSPLMAGSIAEGGEIRDLTSQPGPSPEAMCGPDHDVRKEDLPIDGSGKGIRDAFDPAARGVGSVGSTLSPFANLRSEKGPK